MTRRSSLPFRFLSTFLAALCLTEAALVHAAEANFWDARRKSVPRAADSLPVALAPLSSSRLLNDFSAIKPQAPSQSLLARLKTGAPGPVVERLSGLIAAVPPALGAVRRVSAPASGAGNKTVILLQDVHRNEEAQRNLAGTVSALAASGRVSLVALEAAFAPLDFEAVRGFENREAVRAAADHFFKEGRISGPVHAAYTSQTVLPPFLGVDDLVLWRANVDAYRRSVPASMDAKAGLAARTGRLSREKARVFSGALKAFDRKMADHRAGRLPFGGYVKALAEHALPGRETSAFLEALAAEETLDFARVESERGMLIREVVRKASRADVERLTNLSLSYRAGALGHTDYYAALAAACRDAGADLAAYPAMDAYLRYVAAAGRVDADALLKETEAAEGAAYDLLAATDEERRLVVESRRLSLAAKLLDFSLTPAEWAQAAGDAGFSADFPTSTDFYRQAEARDRAMARNLLKAMGPAPSGAAVLVAGGFHTAGMTRLLTEAGAAVIEVAPALTKVDGDASAYLGVFTRERSPLENLFKGDRLFVAAQPDQPGGVRMLAAAVDAWERGEGFAGSLRRLTGAQALWSKNGKDGFEAALRTEDGEGRLSLRMKAGSVAAFSLVLAGAAAAGAAADAADGVQAGVLFSEALKAVASVFSCGVSQWPVLAAGLGALFLFGPKEDKGRRSAAAGPRLGAFLLAGAGTLLSLGTSVAEAQWWSPSSPEIGLWALLQAHMSAEILVYPFLSEINRIIVRVVRMVQSSRREIPVVERIVIVSLLALYAVEILSIDLLGFGEPVLRWFHSLGGPLWFALWTVWTASALFRSRHVAVLFWKFFLGPPEVRKLRHRLGKLNALRRKYELNVWFQDILPPGYVEYKDNRYKNIAFLLPPQEDWFEGKPIPLSYIKLEHVRWEIELVRSSIRFQQGYQEPVTAPGPSPLYAAIDEKSRSLAQDENALAAYRKRLVDTLHGDLMASGAARKDFIMPKLRLLSPEADEEEARQFLLQAARGQYPSLPRRQGLPELLDQIDRTESEIAGLQATREEVERTGLRRRRARASAAVLLPLLMGFLLAAGRVQAQNGPSLLSNSESLGRTLLAGLVLAPYWLPLSWVFFRKYFIPAWDGKGDASSRVKKENDYTALFFAGTGYFGISVVLSNTGFNRWVFTELAGVSLWGWAAMVPLLLVHRRAAIAAFWRRMREPDSAAAERAKLEFFRRRLSEAEGQAHRELSKEIVTWYAHQGRTYGSLEEVVLAGGEPWARASSDAYWKALHYRWRVKSLEGKIRNYQDGVPPLGELSPLDWEIRRLDRPSGDLKAAERLKAIKDAIKAEEKASASVPGRPGAGLLLLLVGTGALFSLVSVAQALAGSGTLVEPRGILETVALAGPLLFSVILLFNRHVLHFAASMSVDRAWPEDKLPWRWALLWTIPMGAFFLVARNGNSVVEWIASHPAAPFVSIGTVSAWIVGISATAIRRWREPVELKRLRARLRDLERLEKQYGLEGPDQEAFVDPLPGFGTERMENRMARPFLSRPMNEYLQGKIASVRAALEAGDWSASGVPQGKSSLEWTLELEKKELARAREAVAELEKKNPSFLVPGADLAGIPDGPAYASAVLDVDLLEEQVSLIESFMFQVELAGNRPNLFKLIVILLSGGRSMVLLSAGTGALWVSAAGTGHAFLNRTGEGFLADAAWVSLAAAAVAALGWGPAVALARRFKNWISGPARETAGRIMDKAADLSDALVKGRQAAVLLARLLRTALDKPLTEEDAAEVILAAGSEGSPVDMKDFLAGARARGLPTGAALLQELSRPIYRWNPVFRWTLERELAARGVVLDGDPAEAVRLLIRAAGAVELDLLPAPAADSFVAFGVVRDGNDLKALVQKISSQLEGKTGEFFIDGPAWMENPVRTALERSGARVAFRAKAMPEGKVREAYFTEGVSVLFAGAAGRLGVNPGAIPAYALYPADMDLVFSKDDPSLAVWDLERLYFSLNGLLAVWDRHLRGLVDLACLVAKMA